MPLIITQPYRNYGPPIIVSPPDQDYNYVGFLANMNGPEGSRTFTDTRGLTITAFGTPTISTEVTKFGESSAKFNGTSDYLVTDRAFLGIGSGSGTYECWFYCTDVSKPIAGILDMREPSIPSQEERLSIDVRAGVLHFRRTSAYSSTELARAIVQNNQWYHVAMSKEAGYLRCFVNGIRVGGSYSTPTNFGVTFALVIGQGEVNRIADGYWPGYIDEVRITQGRGRYVENFAVPTAPFANTK